MNTSTSANARSTQQLPLIKRIGQLAYRVLESMTESSYQGFIARQGYRYAYI